MENDILTPQGRFEYAINIIFAHEGGYSNDKADPGGETNFGITKKDLQEHTQELSLDVKELSREQAKYFYKKVYWDKYHYDAINSLPIATKIFDMSVNMGAHEAHILVQRALTYCDHSEKVAIDGILAGKSFGAINELCTNGHQADFRIELINEAKWFYNDLVKEKPALDKFLNGWLERAAW